MEEWIFIGLMVGNEGMKPDSRPNTAHNTAVSTLLFIPFFHTHQG